MTEPITFKHSFNSGDLLTVMPSIKNLYRETGRKAKVFQRLNLPADYSHNDNHPIMHNGKMVCMNEGMFYKLKPLIEAQEYIEGFEIWQGEQVLFDIDITRHNSQMPLPGGEIHYWPTLVFPQLRPDFSEPWLDVPWTSVGNRVFINRTVRYRNPYISFFFLKELPPKWFAFVGTEQEHEEFNKSWGLEIVRAEAANFLHLASAIKSCAFFIGNQSMCWHISDGLQVKRILEVCTAYPNTFPKGKNGYAFLTQNSLEHYFSELLKETANEK
jgi:hypothetical protein